MLQPSDSNHPSRLTAMAGVVSVLVVAILIGIAVGARHGRIRQPRAQATRARPVATPQRALDQTDRAGGRVADAGPLHATVTVGPDAPTLRVPRSYFGLSTEYWAMPLFERYMSEFERILRLLHVHGNGALSLRIGGDSADYALFDPKVPRVPKSVFELTPGWFRQASVVIGHVGAQVIFDLNLATDLPSMAAQWARAAETEMPPHSSVGYEVGNEPDLYNPTYWSQIFEPLERPLGIRLFKHQLTATEYVQLYQSYAKALATFAPHMPLAAPVLAYPERHLEWIRTLLASPHPELGLITTHQYPYSACAAPGSPDYPTIPKLLSTRATAGMVRLLMPAIDLAHQAGYPFRLTELNSVTCGGVARVSNTFATALWAPDALFELLQAGLDGVNIHVRAYAINAAFALTGHGLAARPLLYGLILFVRTLGTDPTLVQARISVPPSQGLKAWAVRVRDGDLHVLLINKSERSATVELVLPASGPASVQRLLAPSVSARSGETLDGQYLGPEDNWRGRADPETITPDTRGFAVMLPATSAALASVHLRAP
ncbi:MAG: glycosyl hydrolase family 79 C-terminal domain-containing protein [Solirubrobacteraceae bacterium]